MARKRGIGPGRGRRDWILHRQQVAPGPRWLLSTKDKQGNATRTKIPEIAKAGKDAFHDVVPLAKVVVTPKITIVSVGSGKTVYSHPEARAVLVKSADTSCNRWTNGFDVSWEAFLNAGGPQGEGAMFKGTRVGWESWFMGQIREIRKAGKKRKLESISN